MDNPDETDLRRSLAAGDQTALAALYDLHGAACYRAALAVGGSASLAEDAVQEVFVRIARDPARPAAAANLAAYLWRMAENAATDLLRAQRRRHQPLDAGQAAPADTAQPDRDARIAAAHASLPVEQRAVVALRVWEGCSLEEAGAVLGVSPNTVSSRWRYALEKLAHLLASEVTS